MRKKEVSDVWMLEKTTTLDQLIIHEGAQIHTPDGKFVAMTINGSGFITPGTYYGDIVLTVADTCHMPPHGLMKMMNRSEEFRCALVINNNEIVKEQSVNELIKGGLVTDRFADSVTIQSSEPSFNGIDQRKQPLSDQKCPPSSGRQWHQRFSRCRCRYCCYRQYPCPHRQL